MPEARKEMQSDSDCHNYNEDDIDAKTTTTTNVATLVSTFTSEPSARARVRLRPKINKLFIGFDAVLYVLVARTMTAATHANKHTHTTKQTGHPPQSMWSGPLSAARHAITMAWGGGSASNHQRRGGIASRRWWQVPETNVL